ncbi:MAG: hypothetical protein AABW89_02265 [Nanoarchaeota archaeon]
MDYKEYALEDGRPIDLNRLRIGFIPEEEYLIIHRNSIILCADVLIECCGGFLLLERRNAPALRELWPVGGRLQKGTSSEEGIMQVAKQESGLDLEDLALLNVSRTYFREAPFPHNKGTDTFNLMYVAKGRGRYR